MKKLLEERKLPPLLEMQSGAPVRTPDDWRTRRRELLALLSREEYGFTPDAPDHVRPEVLREENACGGKATLFRVQLTFPTPGEDFSFPFSLVMPKKAQPVPAFVYINFHPDLPNCYLPLEEIIDHGFAVAMLYYKDVTDDSDKWDGLAAMYPAEEASGWGKIGIWAFACSRIMDYLTTLPAVDPARVCVSGHSRLGKTALWCAAQDERFSMAVANESGCAGAAISRGKVGETVRAIVERFPYWFCANYRSWADREAEAPFDQHMLLALVAPRRLYVSSAEEDKWADPTSELLGAAAASEAWRFLRMPGLVVPEGVSSLTEAGEAVVDTAFHGGCVAYHQRRGSHYHGREDWLLQMTYREKHNV